MTRLVLVSGMPGAGKTTLAVALARQLGAVRLCPDEWLVPLGVDPHDAGFRHRMERVLRDFARQLLAVGTSVVMESGFWSRSERERCRRAAREWGVEVELHALDVDFEERWRRIDQRNRSGHAVQITREQLAHYEQWWQPPTAEELAGYDPPSVLPGFDPTR